MSGTLTKERRECDLIRRVCEALPAQNEAEVRCGICATVDLLSGRIDRGEAIKLIHLFPQELRELWPRIIREAAREREAHAR